MRTVALTNNFMNVSMQEIMTFRESAEQSRKEAWARGLILGLSIGLLLVIATASTLIHFLV